MRKIKHKQVLILLFYILLFARLKAENGVIELETQKSVIDLEKESIETKGNVSLKYNDVTIQADNLKKLAKKNIIFAHGNVEFNQGSQIIKADQVVYDMDNRKAKMFGAESYDVNLKLRYGGEEILSEEPDPKKSSGKQSPRKITVKNGWFTSSPYEKPNYKVNSRELDIYPNRKVVAKDIGIVVAGKTWLKLPYYVVSLKPQSQRATLFPYIGSDSDRGLYGIWGFDYDKGPLAQGFVDFELSAKKKLALKFSNDYNFSNGNSGNIFINRLVVPIGNRKREWDFSLNHKFVSTPKKEAEDRKFYDLGYGIWNLNYKNMTTNLMRAVDGVKLNDDYTAYVNKYNKIGLYDFKIDQELGRNGEFNLNYNWTSDREALRELTKINNDIVDRDELDPRKTDVDLYKSVKYINGNNDVSVGVDNEEFMDINPGYVGDLNSYRKKRNYFIDLRGPKIRFEYLNSDKDEYGEVRGMRERDDADWYSLETGTIRWVPKVAYDKRKEQSMTFGNYYPFKKSEFFGYEPRTAYQNLTNTLYFGAQTKQVDVKRKEYEYDYTRDNPNYNNLFLDLTADANSKTYKVYEDAERIRRAKKIISEKYRSQKFNVGNDRIDIPLKDSYISYDFSIEARDYENTYIPEFSGGRKIEDVNSTTGYKLATDASGNPMKQKPAVNIGTLNAKLYTTIFDNTAKTNNKYDVKVVNDADFTFQKVDAKRTMFNGYDIIETPTDVLGLKNNFRYSIGNVNFNYILTMRDDKHAVDNWLKNRYVRNYLKADIDNKRFVSLDFERNDEYEFENFRSEQTFNREVQYGYVTDNDNAFLYRYSDRNKRYFPYNETIGWDRKKYKEAYRDRTFGVNFNEWGVEYSNVMNQINDIYGNSATFGTPDLKLKTNLHRFGFVYDTTKMKNKKFESDHYFRASYGFGKKKYRDINATPTNATDDVYSSGSDYTTISLLYRYENNAKPKYAKDKTEETEKVANENQDIKLVQDSNTKEFSIANSNNQIDKINIDTKDQLFLSNEEEQAYKSYVEEEKYRQNKFNLNDFNSKLQDLRKGKKYFQVGLDMEIDGSDSLHKTNYKGIDRLNDLTFKIEAGYLEKFFMGYKFIMERPDRIYRDVPGRKSAFNFRKHELEGKYMFGQDPDKPWWVGAKVQYVQDGAPKASDPEIFESSSAAIRANKLTLGMATISHRFENVEWEIGAGMKWDKPDNKKLGYYPVVTLKFGIVTFPEKNVQLNYSGGGIQFGAGL